MLSADTKTDILSQLLFSLPLAVTFLSLGALECSLQVPCPHLDEQRGVSGRIEGWGEGGKEGWREGRKERWGERKEDHGGRKGESELCCLLTVRGVMSPADDYYDTEDPSVNLHDFLVNSLQAQKWVGFNWNAHAVQALLCVSCACTTWSCNSVFLRNRVVLLKLEEEFLTYVTDPKRYTYKHVMKVLYVYKCSTCTCTCYCSCIFKEMES